MSESKPVAPAPSGRRNAPPPEAIRSLNRVIVEHIERALRATGGQVEGAEGAAALLEINPHTLRARMRRLGINWAQFRANEDDGRSATGRLGE
jgi:transcriptional regulator with GAF, ATPase, and Fis domain